MLGFRSIAMVKYAPRPYSNYYGPQSNLLFSLWEDCPGFYFPHASGETCKSPEAGNIGALTEKITGLGK